MHGVRPAETIKPKGTRRMRRITFLAVACVALVAVIGAAPGAVAASPGGGTLSKTRPTLTWSGGSSTSHPTGDAQTISGGLVQSACPLGAGDPTCDHFALTVKMGQGAKIKVSIRSSSSGLEALQAVLFGPNDFDLYVYDANGNEVGESADPSGNQTVEFTHQAALRGKPYDVRVNPYFVVPGATYKGTVRTLQYAP